ncbi:MAG: glutathione S-transferase [Pseudomonadota bacterium]
MSEFVLHCFAESGNAYKVALLMEVSGLDWAPVDVDFFGGQTRAAQWREDVNEMGEVPVLFHKGLRLTQSGVILHYLSDLLGKYGGRDDAEKREIWRWILFDNHKFTSYFVTHRWQRHFARPKGHPEVLAFLRTRVDAALAIVEKRLASRDFLLGEAISIADFSLIGYLYFPSEETGYDLISSHPCIWRWMQRIRQLPRWKHPYELLPKSRFRL